MAELSPPMRRIVSATLMSGMRQSEVVLLRKCAVDLDARMITLTRTKPNKVKRVHINDALAAVLDDAMAKSSTEYVFVSRAGKPYTLDGVRCNFSRAVKRAGIEDFCFHDTRHTVATRLRQNGVGIDAIAEVLGHASLAMTMRYAHIGAETMRTAMATLDSGSTAGAAEPEASRAVVDIGAIG